MNPTASASTPSHAGAGATAAASRNANVSAANSGSAQGDKDAFAALMNELFADGGAALATDAGASGAAAPTEDAAGKSARAGATPAQAADPMAFLAGQVPPTPAWAVQPEANLRLPAGGTDSDKGGFTAVAGSTGTTGTITRGKPLAGADDLGLLPAGGPAGSTSSKAAAEPFAAALAQASAGRIHESREPAAGAHATLEGLAATGHASSSGGTEASSATHQAALPSQPLDAAFPGDLAAEVKVMLEGGLQSAELHLNPSELGPIRISLSIDGQNADISFAAAHGTTREGIEQAIPELREMLAEQGLSLTHTGVSSGQQEGFAQAREQQAQAGEAARRSGGAGPGDQATTPAGAQPVAVRAGRGLLDLYA